MRKYNIISLLIVLVLIMENTSLLHSQVRYSVVDENTLLPIARVSIHTRNGDQVLGVMSDAEGKFSIDFPFQSLSFSHLNYEKLEISKNDIKDTVFLTPTYTLLDEITVSNKQPEWIMPLLKSVVKNKKHKYRTEKKQFEYSYTTYTLSDTTGYAFSSKGKLLMPAFNKKEKYSFFPSDNLIQYKDTLAGPDFSNFQRMLYEDFIEGFDNAFLKEHTFSQYASYVDNDPNLVRLFFISNKHDDEGYLLVDTLKKVILECDRKSGTDYNLKDKTSAFLRRTFDISYGLSYEEWFTQTVFSYTKSDEGYYLSDSKYKLYIRLKTENKKGKNEYFTSSESQLVLNETKKTSQHIDWLSLPKPHYLTIIQTKKMRLEEEALRKIPLRFELF